MSQLSDERRTSPPPFRPITLWALLRQSPLLLLLLAVALTLAASLAFLSAQLLLDTSCISWSDVHCSESLWAFDQLKLPMLPAFACKVA